MDYQAEYDNGAKVPGYPAIAERWLTEAAFFRASHPFGELSIPYGPGERQALDLFRPGPAPGGPVVVFVHGGYWQRSHRHAFSHLAQGLLAHGVTVAIPSYDLCPQVSLAALVEQVRDAVAFLHRRLGGRFLVTGHSAGGHLAAMLMATDWAARGAPSDLVPACMPISGLFDLEPLIHTTVNDALGLDVAEARRLSPVLLPLPRGRIHAYVGGEEGVEYTRQSRTIAQAWGGGWTSLPGLHHFSIVEELQNPGSAMVATARALLPAP
ncbi:MAG: alpha/beta hydrolase [Acetobacteraceae bacterium]|nr:alpha/beta hydrolase [Acetobacteraceae bacterium]